MTGPKGVLDDDIIRSGSDYKIIDVHTVES